MREVISDAQREKMQMVQRKQEQIAIDKLNQAKSLSADAAAAVAKYNRDPNSFSSRQDKLNLYETADKYGLSTYFGRQKDTSSNTITDWQKLAYGVGGFADEYLLFGLLPNEKMVKLFGHEGSEDALKAWRTGEWAGLAAGLVTPGLNVFKGVGAATKAARYATKAAKLMNIADDTADIVRSVDKATDAYKAAKTGLKSSVKSKLIKEATEKALKEATEKAGKKLSKTMVTKTSNKAAKEITEEVVDSSVKGAVNAVMDGKKTYKGSKSIIAKATDLMGTGADYKEVGSIANKIKALEKGSIAAKLLKTTGPGGAANRLMNTIRKSTTRKLTATELMDVQKIVESLPAAQRIKWIAVLRDLGILGGSYARMALQTGANPLATPDVGGSVSTAWEEFQKIKQQRAIMGNVGNVPVRK